MPLRIEQENVLLHTFTLFQHFGTFLRIHYDYGREFDNTLLKYLCKLYDIKLYFNVAHAQSNGWLERFHVTLAKIIRVNKAANLDFAMCYNNSINKTHFTPFD